MPEETEGRELDLDAPLEERREPLVDKGSASGMPGEAGMEASDLRVGGPEEDGAGTTGAATRDVGEEGDPGYLDKTPSLDYDERDEELTP